ncbi:MAG: serine hydrolase [Candidatus Omnitrophica bacterium]|nr:serine hydrolase [Candidatus Omnitrophota bacterium]
MRQIFFWFIIATVLLVLVITRLETAFRTELSTGMAKVVDEVIKKYNIPGAVVGVWHGRRAWVYAAGLSDIGTKTAMRPDCRFRIASNTKTFTATVVLQLAAKKKLSLDDKLDKFFPRIPNSGRITIRQLLNHTSGIYDFVEDKDFEKAYLADPLRKWTPQEEIDIVLKHKPDFAPGEKWKYSNSNYTLLGMIIEKVTGSKIESEVSRRIIKPLGLYHTNFPVTPYIGGRYSHGYMDDGKGGLKDITKISPSIPWAGGAMISNIYDLKRWLRVLAKGSLIGNAMRKEQQDWVSTGVEGMEFGLGIMDLKGFIGHNGEILGFASFMLYSPQRDMTIILFVNKCNEDEKIHPTTDILKGIFEALSGKEGA